MAMLMVITMTRTIKPRKRIATINSCLGGNSCKESWAPQSLPMLQRPLGKCIPSGPPTHHPPWSRRPLLPSSCFSCTPPLPKLYFTQKQPQHLQRTPHGTHVPRPPLGKKMEHLSYTYRGFWGATSGLPWGSQAWGLGAPKGRKGRKQLETAT